MAVCKLSSTSWFSLLIHSFILSINLDIYRKLFNNILIMISDECIAIFDKDISFQRNMSRKVYIFNSVLWLLRHLCNGYFIFTISREHFDQLLELFFWKDSFFDSLSDRLLFIFLNNFRYKRNNVSLTTSKRHHTSVPNFSMAWVNCSHPKDSIRWPCILVKKHHSCVCGVPLSCWKVVS